MNEAAKQELDQIMELHWQETIKALDEEESK